MIRGEHVARHHVDAPDGRAALAGTEEPMPVAGRRRLEARQKARHAAACFRSKSATPWPYHEK